MAGWLSHGEDEVAAFHPAFQAAADSVLSSLGLATQYRWVHHPPSFAGATIPDFVLTDRATGQWLLIVELKRNPAAVFSARFQSQAKGYADANQSRFRAGHPVYFAISNLEVSVLCALNGARPPTECVVDGGIARSGSFATDDAVEHREQFERDLAAWVTRVLVTNAETFDVVWPPIIAAWLQHAEMFAAGDAEGPEAPTTPGWPEVNSYFGQAEPTAAARVTLLQALLASYLRGRLVAVGHPRAGRVPPALPRGELARAIDALRAIDFDSVFDAAASDRVRNASGTVRAAIDAFLTWLGSLRPSVSELAQTRHDHVELVENAVLAIYPPEARAGVGKVQTDPELADVLAAMTLSEPVEVIDPCCGDGPLLVAAFDRLVRLGVPPADALSATSGIEADPVLGRLAAVRLTLRAIAALGPAAQPVVTHGDMFAAATKLAAVGAVLMNPPFRRYEDQGGPTVPEPLTRHYREAIRSARGRSPSTLEGQPNLFHYYVEFVTGATSVGTRVGIVLDNKWYHSRAGRPLRELVKEKYRLLALVEYPHRFFFSSWDIATSLLIAERDDSPPADHEVLFVRTAGDPRQVDLDALSAAVHHGAGWPTDWRARVVRQGDLDAAVGWKPHFASALPVDLSTLGLVPLVTLFDRSRRGSLEKEGGGSQVFALPFTRTNFGARRGPRAPGSTRFATTEERPLTPSENAELTAAARAIPASFRGRALKNSDQISGYVLDAQDVERDQTLEPPALRREPSIFVRARRSPWTAQHQEALSEITLDPAAGVYLQAVERIVNLTSDVLADEDRFVDLREPYAGELIIPRKLRAGHRVHVNPFAWTPHEQQIRISTNFVSYGGCLAQDPDAGLDSAAAATMIAAFLVSSFGQLQFEQAGVNREGLLAIEKGGMDTLLVTDPRRIDPQRRAAILQAFAALPFPVPSGVLSANQARVEIDRLFAEELAPMAGLSVDELLLAVHDAVDEWITARQP